ncbi:MAG: AMP-binding protein, partial [Pseudomonadota bacterium]|nr:AMP-binding protein [Pseudomonadota bacterium]
MTDYPANTVIDLLQRGATAAPAIGAPSVAEASAREATGRPWLTYGRLRDLTARTVADLNGMGIGRGDRVAIVAPNGPEMATAFVAIVTGATTAPLNPAYKADEFRFYLSDLDAKALVIRQGMDSPARGVAAERGIPVVELIPTTQGPAGDFTLKPEQPLSGAPARPGPAGADDVALVLHTSGTTSRPKIVPLRHVNVTASAYNVAETLALTPD